MTVKDVAREAGISFSVAAAVLRGQNGTIRYSEETKNRVLSAATKLDYHPNLLAQAMTSGKIPLVAVSLHLENFRIDEANLYMHDSLMSASQALRQGGMEMVFLPYADHEEQVERLKNLVDGRLVSGVISNFIIGENEPMINYLKAAGIPFVILGNHPDHDICRVYRDDSGLHDLFSVFAAERGFKRVIQAGVDSDGDWDFLEFDGKKRYMAIIDEKDFGYQDTNTVFFMSNDHLRKFIGEKAVPQSRIIVVDDWRRPVTFRPAIQVRPTTGRGVAAAVGLLLEWLERGIPPSEKSRIISPDQDDFKILQ